jgi:hypothetical protein
MPFIPFAGAAGAAMGAGAASSSAAAWAGGIAIASVASSIAGGTMSAMSAYSQGQAQKSMYKYQADVAERQQAMAAQSADMNSQLGQLQASQDAKQLQRKYMVIEGEQRANAAAMGIGGGSVTEGDIATDTFNTRKADEDMIRYRADLHSWSLKNQAVGEIWNLGNQASMDRVAGRNAAKAGAISGTGTIFSTAGNVGLSAYKLKTA